jgi:hypothetical protein
MRNFFQPEQPWNMRRNKKNPKNKEGEQQQQTGGHSACCTIELMPQAETLT